MTTPRNKTDPAGRDARKAGAPGRAVRVVGLTGGIASGKSTVARMFADLGAAVIDADAVVQALLDAPEMIERLRRAWGEEYLGPDGRPDRRKIAERVFQDAERLREWTGWVHPPVQKKIREQVDSVLRNPAILLIIIDAPLLLETGLDSWCDTILFVDADPSLRAERARASRDWPEGELQRRESWQAPLDVKRRTANVVISNSGTREETFRTVERLFRQWTHASPSSKSQPSLFRR